MSGQTLPQLRTVPPVGHRVQMLAQVTGLVEVDPRDPFQLRGSRVPAAAN